MTRAGDEPYVEVCLRCKATVDMGVCLCPDGRAGDTAWITWDEHTTWKMGTLPKALRDPADPAPPHRQGGETT